MYITISINPLKPPKLTFNSLSPFSSGLWRE